MSNALVLAIHSRALPPQEQKRLVAEIERRVSVIAELEGTYP